jgi:hypothetical protein
MQNVVSDWQAQIVLEFRNSCHSTRESFTCRLFCVPPSPLHNSLGNIVLSVGIAMLFSETARQMSKAHIPQPSGSGMMKAPNWIIYITDHNVVSRESISGSQNKQMRVSLFNMHTRIIS